MSKTTNHWGLTLLAAVSRLLKTLWLFFPGILFLILAILVFWTLGQGKDIIVAFTENRSRTILQLNYTRIIFFVAIGFWVYVSWYSSRIIGYIKRTKQVDIIQRMTGADRPAAEDIFLHDREVELNQTFLSEAPRLIGNACFLILELAVLRSPILPSPISNLAAILSMVAALIILGLLSPWISRQAEKPYFRPLFWWLLALLLVFILATAFLTQIDIRILLVQLILFHILFNVYIHLRRVMVEKKVKQVYVGSAWYRYDRGLEKLMNYFCVPIKESGYFRWFLIIGIAGVLVYLLVILLLPFARAVGPFPFIILAFGVLLAFGNAVTAFSLKYKVNFHFILLVLALLLGTGETHYVRTKQLAEPSPYASRPSLSQYLKAWIGDRKQKIDSSGEYDIYFVLANGGASRSAYWTAAALGKLEDRSLGRDARDRFSNHVFALSGTSGGGVGVAAFFTMLRGKDSAAAPSFERSAKEFLRKDYFTYTFARMLGPDFFNYIFHVSASKDRAAALEASFEDTTQQVPDGLIRLPFEDNFSLFPALKNGRTNLPILFVNTTRMQDGNPGVVTNLKLDSALFNNRVDVVSLLDPSKDISVTSAAILGARFPYLSPAGRIANSYFVDGGYFDNSGAGVVQETIRGILNLAKTDSSVSAQIDKFHFKVLHILNSPVTADSGNIKPVAPIKNDLFAPILTIVGAYDMQTTVNDGRLVNFLRDINRFTKNKADYIPISLYLDQRELMEHPFPPGETEPPYAMNWFMSDTTLRRIDRRLEANPVLDSLGK